ncbi:unnamed protein product [Peniophora sp. CBMAI 1063]|nr:unnamed protein product [Peniophora sp. CBMAI 1063]
MPLASSAQCASLRFDRAGIPLPPELMRIIMAFWVVLDLPVATADLNRAMESGWMEDLRIPYLRGSLLAQPRLFADNITAQPKLFTKFLEWSKNYPLRFELSCTTPMRDDENILCSDISLRTDLWGELISRPDAVARVRYLNLEDSRNLREYSM